MEQQTLTPPPPELPELPAGARREPRWPAWSSVAAFGVGLVVTFVVVGIAAAIAGPQVAKKSPTFEIVATLIQSAAFLGAAILFASLVAKPKAWQFGLRRTPFWPAVGWAALGLVTFYVFSAVYTALVSTHAKQTITDKLGAGSGTVGLIAAGAMVICVAPVFEELFFRGFFYRALRNRFVPLTAAGLDGLLFGVIHYDFSTTSMLLILPPLAYLGFMFCLVYERTGSIFPTIALHSFNNTIAFGVQAHGWSVSAFLGPLMLAACCLAPRAFPPRS